MNIPMVDLQGQYNMISNEIEAALLDAAKSARYIKGPQVKEFEENLQEFLNVDHIISCGNGTDALQIALMALELKPGDEVIVPAFTYVATAEVIALLRLKPVMVDVDYETFNISLNNLSEVITERTKAIVPVHLFGLAANMEEVMTFARKHDLYVIEDTAQSLGTEIRIGDGQFVKGGTIGHIGCHSFFPTKNLGCFGDGGAISTNDEQLAAKCRMIASHGQAKKYYHDVVGVNSRLDTLQAAVLNVKLKYLNSYIANRIKAADYYLAALRDVDSIILPIHDNRLMKHTYNQFTLKVKNGKRDELKEYLNGYGIPSMIYYPLPLYKQKAFAQFVEEGFELENTEKLCDSVLSIPMHTELNVDKQDYIIEKLKNF